MIYFDNAATTKTKPQQVIDAVVEAMKTAGNASRGVYNESLSSDRIIFNARKTICELFNADNPRQVAFSKNSTESLNVAIKGIAEKGDHFITTDMEHNSVLRPIHYLVSEGVIEADYIPLDEKGNLKIEYLKKYIRPNTKAFVVNHGSNVTGNINDLTEIGRICEKNNILLVVDASQTAGSVDIDMQKMKIDILCFTGHKSLLGPQGTGGICVSEKVSVKPLIVGGTGIQTYNEFHVEQMPTRLEAGTQNAHGIAGLLAGVRYIKENGVEKLHDRAQHMADRFFNGISQSEKVKVYGDYDAEMRCPIVSLNIADMDSSQVSMILSQEYGISTRPGAHCAPRLHKSMGTVDQGMVRFSFSHFNTEDEVDTVVEAIKNIIDLSGGE